MDNLDLYRRILDLQREVQELYGENLDLREHVRELNEQRKIEENLRFDGGAWWVEFEDKHPGPYCATCWPVEQKLIPLIECGDGERVICEHCGKSIVRPAPPRVR